MGSGEEDEVHSDLEIIVDEKAYDEEVQQ